jgi:parallel beta-helix repeat protein
MPCTFLETLPKGCVFRLAPGAKGKTGDKLRGKNSASSASRTVLSNVEGEWAVNKPVGWKMRSILWIGFVLMCIASRGMAAEDVPDKTRQRYVIFEDNELYQNNLAGIRIRGSMPVTIKTCEVYSNGRAGIVVDNQAQAMLTGCNVFRNGRAGINIEEAGYTTIENSRIYENNRAGVRIWKSVEKA